MRAFYDKNSYNINYLDKISRGILEMSQRREEASSIMKSASEGLQHISGTGNKGCND